MYNSIADSGNLASMTVTTTASKYKDKSIGGGTYNRERRAKSQYYGMSISVVTKIHLETQQYLSEPRWTCCNEPYTLARNEYFLPSFMIGIIYVLCEHLYAYG